VAWRDPSEQISLIKRANNMKKLRGSTPPLSKHEQRCMQRIQARLLREYRGLDQKDRAARFRREVAPRHRKQLHSRVAACWAIEMRRMASLLILSFSSVYPS